MSRRFAVSGGNKFVDVPMRRGHTGAPVLAEALGHVECRIVDILEGGDHTIFLGQVESAMRATASHCSTFAVLPAIGG